MATVTGLPLEFDEDDDYESESEVEDEADEDSNGMSSSLLSLFFFGAGLFVELKWFPAEDYYKNDYPDEESSE